MFRDLRYAVRMLRSRVGFTTAAVISLALGIGACTAIFSVVDGVLLRSLPYPDADRIVQLREVTEKGAQMPVTEPNYVDVRARSHSLEALAQYAGSLTTVTGGSEPVRLRTNVVSREFFRVLGIQPVAGRLFLPEESQPGSRAVAVVSYGFWQRLLGGRTDLTDTTLKVFDQSFAVVGVMPREFSFPKDTEVWIPREVFPTQASRTAHNWSVIGRVQSGVPLEQAIAEVSAIGKQLREQYGTQTDAADFALVPLQEYLVGKVRGGLLILLGAVGFLLLIACANVANLMLAQVTARKKELAVRAALGATRWRLARQFITESLLLASIAGALGVVLSLWGVDFLIGLDQKALPRASEISVDARALLFTLGLSFLIAVVLGLVPAFRSSGTDLVRNLKEAGRGQSASAATSRLRSLLVVSQVALTLMLLIGAGLLGKSFLRLLQIDPGFRVESAVAMELSLASAEDEKQEKQLARFNQQLLERLGRLPGVVAAGGVDSLPMTGTGSNGTFLIDNDPARTGYAEYRVASPGYFSAIGIPLLAGRPFEQSDTADSVHVAVISQSLARKVWPDEDPIGKRIQFGNMDGDKRLLNVVGIVGDVHEKLDSDVRPTVYADSFQRPQRSSVSIIARANIGTVALISGMRGELLSLNPELPANFRTLDQIFSSSLDERRFNLILFGVFAAVALMLAITGIYGVMSYSVTQRTNEIGIRIALGAKAGDVLKLVVGQGVLLAAIGVVIGLGGAFALTRLLSSLLFGVSATDLAIFAGVSLLLASVALLACYVPARRAMKVDPIVALRYE
ncbi:MAG: ABC transporter permease [Acidobacteriota bacterium]